MRHPNGTFVPASEIGCENPFDWMPRHGSERACHEGDCKRCQLEQEVLERDLQRQAVNLDSLPGVQGYYPF